MLLINSIILTLFLENISPQILLFLEVFKNGVSKNKPS